MQLLAHSEKRDLIHASQAKKQQSYFCLECQSEVRVRGGYQRQLHYFHIEPNRACQQHQKGLIHLQIQNYFYKHLPIGDCKLEFRFPTIGRIADVVWMSKKIVFEIQYSPISAEEIQSRNTDYAKMGWDVVWILHEHRYNQYRLTAAENALKNHTHYFCSIDATGKGIIYDQYDSIMDSKRKFKFDPLPVKVVHAQNRTDNSSPSQNVFPFNKRRLLWKYTFEGDLNSLYENNPNDSYIERVINYERTSKVTFFQQIFNITTYSINLFVVGYKLLFRYFMEKICR